MNKIDKLNLLGYAVSGAGILLGILGGIIGKKTIN